MEERLLLLSLLWLLLIRRRRRHQRIRRNRIYSVHPLLKNRSQSQFRTVYPKLRRLKEKFYKKFRMNKNTFDYMLNELNSELQKKNTAMRKSIPSVERLAMTLRWVNFFIVNYFYMISSIYRDRLPGQMKLIYKINWCKLRLRTYLVLLAALAPLSLKKSYLFI